MSDKLGKAVLELSIDDNKYRTQLDAASKGARGLAADVKAIGQNLNLLVFKEFGEIAVKAIGAVIGKIIELGAHGSDVADVRGSFEGLTKGVGETAGVMLGALRQGTQGTISDFELMQTANKALGAGLKLSAADMATLAGGAKMLADRTGKDTKDAFDALTKAMITGRTKGLADFGFAAKDGQAVLGDLAAQLAQAGGPTLDFADRVNVAKAMLTNFTDQVAEGISQSPVLAAGLDALGASLAQAFSADKQGAVGATVGLVESLAVGLVKTASAAVSVAQFLTNAFLGARAILNLVLEGIFTGLGKVQGAIASLAEKASALPGVGEQFKSLAAGLRQGADFANSLAFGFGELKDKALDSAASATAGYTAVQKTLGNLVTAMQNAKDVTVETAAVSSMAVEALATTHETAAARIILSKQLVAQDLQAFAAQELLLQQTADAAMLALLQQSLAAQAAAQGAYAVQTMTMASEAGFKTREELEATAKKAIETHQRMLQSGLYTAAVLQAAWENAEKAKQDASEQTAKDSTEKMLMIADASSSILRSLFGKNKAAAIAAAVIDTAAAVVSSFKNAGGFPWGLIPAAAMAAAGYAQIQKIRSQNAGFAEGTPRLDFAGFGAVADVQLHGSEAVIPRGGGHQLAGEIAGAMNGNGDAVAELKGIREAFDGLPFAMRRAFRDALRSS